jgi:hypothetical protein
MISPSPVNDSFKQARQGSISAIIQVLNEKLAGRGIRTRAMVDNNILQLLCEADAAANLDRSVLVKSVRSVLEEVSPRNVRRVNINARIIQEQQLLWLDELKGDLDKQPLWSEEITLVRPNLMKHRLEEIKGLWGSKGMALPVVGASNSRWKGDRKPTPKVPLWLMFGLLGTTLVLGVAYWRMPGGDHTASQNVIASPENPKRDQTLVDPFDRAVSLAGEASAEGTKANSSAEWKAIALKWKAASDLMGQVPESHPRYELAQNRTKSYQANQVIADRRSQ